MHSYFCQHIVTETAGITRECGVRITAQGKCKDHDPDNGFEPCASLEDGSIALVKDLSTSVPDDKSVLTSGAAAGLSASTPNDKQDPASGAAAGLSASTPNDKQDPASGAAASQQKKIK
jgi:hypothetical protein